MKIVFSNGIFYVVIILLGLLSSCIHNNDEKLFTQLQSKESGIRFRNELNDDDSSRSFINEFGYMGGGVGIGDFNNDGLKDIFFTGNQVSCELYINKGGNQYENISEKAGIKTNVWATGVSIADINNDGYDDIYICVFGKDLIHPARNLLFINQHDLTFKEEAQAYGLAFTGYSTQAVFLDYDRDGDLDMYLVNYLLGTHTNSITPRDLSGRFPANDKLFRNDGDPAKKGHPVFSDLTQAAGIRDDGYGLGVAVSDFNNDGWSDIYVANDFLSNDALWLNNQDGTFTNCIDKAVQHQSYSSMGADVADINNDGLPDIMTLDMLPESNRRKKESFFFMNYERYQAERAMGYEPEFMRNMLQLNNGCIRNGKNAVPFFSEIGQMAGVEATDWSWSVLLADFNNDGWKDIHITNGIGRDFINGDFLEYSGRIFNSNKNRQEQERLIRARLSELDHVNLSNYLYLNNRDLTFFNASAKSGTDEPSMSNGAAYADLDNDGDLDLVVNNIDKEAFVFLNNTIQKGRPVASHFLSIRLVGDSLNRAGFGAKVCIYKDGRMQMEEENPVRGYFSSVDQRLFFGLGKETRDIDSLIVSWSGGRTQKLGHITGDTVLTLFRKNALTTQTINPDSSGKLFTDISSTTGIFYKHVENAYNDFSVQRLLPHKYSQLGPFIAAGDYNNDHLTDFFVGGGYNFSGKLFTQKKDQTFTPELLTDSIKMEEDMGCVFLDADQDGDLDLLITNGDVQYEDTSVYYKPRLYLNDGKGNFKLRPDAIPQNVKTIAGCVSAADFDGDGDIDLFIGGRVSKQYPLPARSFILENKHGIFTEVTSKVCPPLERPGMLTAAIWVDFDNDNQKDLVIAGEWMPLRFFKNNHGTLKEVTGSTGLTHTSGMWRSLIGADLDDDGDTDLVAGNLGLNCQYRVTPDQPMQLFASDIDNNGRIDPILFYYVMDEDGKKRSHPAFSRNQLAEQVPVFKKKFIRYADYARAGLGEIIPGRARSSMLSLTCDESRSCWFENLGNGKFIKHILPAEAQFSPVNAIVCDDLDKDGYKDLLLAGNDFQTDVVTGRYDASFGCFLRGGSKKAFTAVPPAKSGFVLRGDIKDMSLITLGDGERVVLAAANNDSLRVFRVNRSEK